MQKRRERIEMWRAEKKKKTGKTEPEPEPVPESTEPEGVKKWSLESSDEEEEVEKKVVVKKEEDEDVKPDVNNEADDEDELDPLGKPWVNIPGVYNPLDLIEDT